MLSNIWYNIKELFLEELKNFFLFIPVLFAIGAVIYYKLSFEPDVKNNLIIILLITNLIFLFRKMAVIRTALIVLFLIFLGLTVTSFRTHHLNAPKISDDLGVKKIYANIDKIVNKNKAKQIIFSDIFIPYYDQEPPKKIRVNFRTKINNAEIGDRVSFLAVLSKPPIAIIPDGYDFSRYAFFKQIGAVGYAVSEIKIFKKSRGLSFRKKIENIRNIIINKTLAYQESDETNIILALTVGEKGGISKDLMEKIRQSGLSHLLAISGMHISLVVMIFFFMTRNFCVLIPKMALKYNVKKIAAFCAMLGGFAYLLISGYPVSAQRAFIMASLFLIAIIIDRPATPLRSVAFAAFCILLLTPETILTPSFQMSFAAVIAIISFYEFFRFRYEAITEKPILQRIFIYFIAVISSSLVAGSATMPFAIYHFSNISSYGVLANLIAIPLTSFIVMPLIILNIIFVFFGLEFITMPILIYFVSWIKKTSIFVADLPRINVIFKEFNDTSLTFFILGAIILCLLKTKLRMVGILPIIIAFFMAMFQTIPDIMISHNSKLIAIKNDENDVYFSSRVKDRYVRTQWQKKYYIDDAKLIKNLHEEKNNGFFCNDNFCKFTRKTIKTKIILQPLDTEKNCVYADLLLNLSDKTYFNCKNNKFTLDKSDLKYHNVSFIYITEKEIRVEKVLKNENNRLWNL